MSIVYSGKTLSGSYLTDLAPLREEVENKADLGLRNLDFDGLYKIGY